MSRFLQAFTVLVILFVISQTVLATSNLQSCDKSYITKQRESFKLHKKLETLGFSILFEKAEYALKQKPLSVIAKSIEPDSHDKHDYMSISYYAWPDPKSKDGKPWIIIDGKANKNRNSLAPDFENMVQTTKRIRQLSLAYAVTSDERYSAKAKELIKVWFINPNTKMNPNLKFAEAIPGKGSGTPFGIIDGVNFIGILDSIQLLDGSSMWTNSDLKEIKEWMRQYKDWLLNSDAGKEEGNQPNNHSTWYFAQIVSLQYFLGQTNEAKQFIEANKIRLFSQIESDGRQTLEIKRSRPLHYSFFNLIGIAQIAAVGKKVGANIWTFVAPSGASVKKAIDYLTPCLGKTAKCPFKAEPIEGDTTEIKNGIDPFEIQYAVEVLRRAEIGFEGQSYCDLSANLEKKIPGQDIKPEILCMGFSKHEPLKKRTQ